MLKTPLKTVYQDPTIIVKVSKKPYRHYIKVPPGAILLPVTDSGKIIVIHEYKVTNKRWVWGFPGGKVMNGETTDQAAKRECEEELGLHVGKVKKICQVRTDFPDTQVYFYLGFKLKKVKARDGEKIGKIKKLTIKKLYQVALNGGIADPRVVVAVINLYNKVKKHQIKLII